jgi:hypothetical protein
VLHRRLVEAGAQSFLITPIALNGARKTDQLDARALCLRLSLVGLCLVGLLFGIQKTGTFRKQPIVPPMALAQQ